LADSQRGLGKCELNHVGSFGYPTRPEEPYPFCPQCGNRMAWRCGACKAPLPEDNEELLTARFCRECGKPYFPDAEGERAPG
jgi:predicted RNA-binding Zn-ribbon protein involved in translation (DUF1610 family)